MKFEFLADAVKTPPERPKNPSIGYPSNGDPLTNRPPTTPGAWFYYMLMVEFETLLKQNGIEPSATNLHQLADFFSGYKKKIETAAGNATAAADKAVNIGTTLDNYINDAREQADAANASAQAVAASAGRAQASENSASDAAKLAKAWATQTDAPVDGGLYGSKKYAEDAAATVASIKDRNDTTKASAEAAAASAEAAAASAKQAAKSAEDARNASAGNVVRSVNNIKANSAGDVTIPLNFLSTSGGTVNGAITVKRVNLGSKGGYLVESTDGALIVRNSVNQDFPSILFGTSGASSRLSFDKSYFNFEAQCRATSFQATSDARLKKNLMPAAPDISRLHCYSYTLKSDGKRHVGLIAQEVQKVMPEAVGKDDKGYLSLDYNSVVAALVEEVNRLRSEIGKIKEKV